MIAAALPAAAIAAPAGADVIRLKGGAVVEGAILKRSDQKVWIDVGPDVLQFRLADVDAIEVQEAAAAGDQESEAVFHTASGLPELSPQEQIGRASCRERVYVLV